MKNAFFLRLFLLLLLVPLSCERLSPDRASARSRRETETGPSADSVRRPSSSPSSRTVYLSAVEYPASYDWERDTAAGAVACRLLLLAGKERICSLPAGPGEEISPDPDMHRIAGGHLYTDYSTADETVVKCDGRDLFRYAGRESIRGFLLHEGQVHTLGVPRSGGGFTYRVDGEIRLQRDGGTLIGDLYAEEGSVCFSFCQPGTGPSGAQPALFLVKGGRLQEVPLPAEVTEVMDQRLSGGILYRVEKRSSHPGRPVLVARSVPDGSLSEYLLYADPDREGDARKCRLLPYGSDMLVRGLYRYSDSLVDAEGAEEFCLWTRSGMIFREIFPVKSFSTLPGVGSGPGPMACVLSTPSGVCIGKGTETWTPIGRYRLFSPSCACLVPSLTSSSPFDAHYYVALSGPSCLLWVDGTVTPIQLHGYISGISVE